MIAPAVLLARMRLTCAQWASLAPTERLARVRAALETHGHASLNTPTRGVVAYELAAAVDAYCAPRAATPAPGATDAGSPDVDDGRHGTGLPLVVPRRSPRR